MRSATWARLVAGVLALSLVLAACGGDDGDGDGDGGANGETNGGATGETTGGAENEILIRGFAFQPPTLTISGATDITVTNEDSATHTFTLDDGSVDESLSAGDSVTVTIDVSASTGFSCTIHPQMTGTIEVA